MLAVRVAKELASHIADEGKIMNLLIVDDIATNRKLLRVTLEAEGYHTLEAADGVEALQILAHETVAAVISPRKKPKPACSLPCVSALKSPTTKSGASSRSASPP